MTPRRLQLLRGALALACLLALSACGGGGGGEHIAKGSSTTTAVTVPSTTSTTLAPGTSEIAEVRGSEVTVYAGPDERSFSKAYPNPWLLNDNPKLGVPQVFAVEEKQGDWLKVLLPVRPNGTTGWVKVSDVNVTTDPYRILVELGAHRITVYQNDNAILQEAVAIGAPATPTPPGKYYLRVLIKAPNPRTVYGPYAFGLSAHSEVLDTFNGGDAEVGIHGNNDASVLGKSVTHGCIRMSNDGVTRLSTLLPLGTPVEIVS